MSETYLKSQSVKIWEQAHPKMPHTMKGVIVHTDIHAGYDMPDQGWFTDMRGNKCPDYQVEDVFVCPATLNITSECKI